MLTRIRGAETIGSELPLHVVEDGVVTERRVDRLIREAGRIVVIDYKSGAAAPERVARDRRQVAAYCAALERITSQPCSGLLWYIDLERDEAVDVER